MGEKKNLTRTKEMYKILLRPFVDFYKKRRRLNLYGMKEKKEKKNVVRLSAIASAREKEQKKKPIAVLY